MSAASPSARPQWTIGRVLRYVVLVVAVVVVAVAVYVALIVSGS